MAVLLFIVSDNRSSVQKYFLNADYLQIEGRTLNPANEEVVEINKDINQKNDIEQITNSIFKNNLKKSYQYSWESLLGVRYGAMFSLKITAYNKSSDSSKSIIILQRKRVYISRWEAYIALEEIDLNSKIFN